MLEVASIPWHLKNWVGVCEMKAWVFAASHETQAKNEFSVC